MTAAAAALHHFTKIQKQKATTERGSLEALLGCAGRFPMSKIALLANFQNSRSLRLLISISITWFSSGRRDLLYNQNVSCSEVKYYALREFDCRLCSLWNSACFLIFLGKYLTSLISLGSTRDLIREESVAKFDGSKTSRVKSRVFSSFYLPPFVILYCEVVSCAQCSRYFIHNSAA